MELRICTEWQQGKSLKECNKYMFENEIATDVGFEVGPQDGNQALVRAHKFILIARSAVFEAMFCGGLAESKMDSNSVIAITDVEVDIFRQLLRFMYCEEATVSADTALPLMYAAKKYLILDLVDQCQKFLQANLTIENVCCILELSLAFDELQLRDRCLTFISKYTVDVLRSQNFLQLSRTTLLEIVRMDCLTISELSLCNACILWARHQIQEESGDHAHSTPSDASIRDALGSVLYRIRFSNMDQVEFSRKFGKSELLSSDEKLSLYYYFNVREEKENLVFDSATRRAHEDVVCRFTSLSSGAWIMNGKVDAIDFMTDKEVILIGLGIYGSPSPAVHDISIEIWTGKILLCIVATKFESLGSTDPIKVNLGQKVKIKPNINNTIVCMIKGPNTLYGCNGEKKVASGGVTFVFSASLKCTGRSSHEVGQIPQLYFTCS